MSLGTRGEELAQQYLVGKGYTCIARNLTTPVGEVDLIVEAPDKTLCFVEVKTRRSLSYGYPQEAVTPRKIHQITKAATYYLKSNGLLERTCRFDVVSVKPTPSTEILECEHIEDAFRL